MVYIALKRDIITEPHGTLRHCLTHIKPRASRFGYAYGMQTSTSPAAPVWDDALDVGIPLIDDDHHTIVQQLAAVVGATDEALLPQWSALIQVVQNHFAMEDRWMQKTGFAPDNCHSSQHAMILKVLREGEAYGHNGQLGVIRQMADELGQWLPLHVDRMDASLAKHLQTVGFDTASETVTRSEALPGHSIHSCGTESCSD